MVKIAAKTYRINCFILVVKKKGETQTSFKCALINRLNPSMSPFIVSNKKALLGNVLFCPRRVVFTEANDRLAMFQLLFYYIQ